MIDHTLLRADATRNEITKLIEEAKQYQFASVCVNPGWVSYASEQLQGTGVDICTVIGFPLGASTSEVKAFETKDAIAKGATEVDMVINVSALKDGNDDVVEQDIRAVVEAAAGTLV
ncbi:MAG: deoxyribose-phosphate aldolase, partial [Paenibacillus sp.]|uniref:deoxyribose-phosphate aldolase n=1 Tax=Paenibacillus sp. TaxID=58172 RepID=UPI0025E86F0A